MDLRPILKAFEITGQIKLTRKSSTLTDLRREHLSFGIGTE